MASHSCEKGQTLVSLCLVLTFLLSFVILSFFSVFQKTNIHINQIENKKFWDKNYEN